MPKSPHELVRSVVNKAIIRELDSMNLDGRLEEDGSTGIDVGGMTRQPDGQWIPTPIPAGASSKPTMVLEVGLSEPVSKLRKDCAMWVDPSRGSINLALMLKIDQRRPKITIELWKWDPANVKAKCLQFIVISESKSGDKVKMTGLPLKIPFDLLFHRQATAPSEKDITFNRNMLDDLARRIWDRQNY